MTATTLPTDDTITRLWPAGAQVDRGCVGPALVGIIPVTLIAGTAFGIADLRVLAIGVLCPPLALAGRSLRHDRELRRLVCRGIAAGLVATLLYDLFGFGFLAAGLLTRDPIPHIGTALHLHPGWLFGCLWRYLGNGSGLAIAFVALGLRGRRVGCAYGLLVCGGLVFTLSHHHTDRTSCSR